MGESRLAFIKDCLAREIIIKQSSFVHIFLICCSIFAKWWIGPEKSGLINHFNVFHQSLGELLFDVSFSTNLLRSALLDFLISFVTKFL